MSLKIDDCLDILKKLIRFPTISSEPNIRLNDYIVEYLTQHGVPVTRFPSKDRPDTHENLLAFMGDWQHTPPILLTGHTDVVPVANQNWTHDPFDMVIRDGKAYGRGTCDMKGQVACILAAVPVLKQSSTPFLLAFTFDEEVGMAGAKEMAEELKKLPQKPRAALVMEGTNLEPYYGHKNSLVCETFVKGKSGHSSKPTIGCNAIEVMTDIMVFLNEAHARKTAHAMAGSLFDPPHSTFNLGVIRGGTADNIIADECTLTWQYRADPADPEDVVASLQAYVDAILLPKWRKRFDGVQIRTRLRARTEPLSPRDNNPALLLVERIAGTTRRLVTSGGTEAGVFQNLAGIDSVVFGPASFNVAHTADEYVEISALENGLRFLEKLSKARI